VLKGGGGKPFLPAVACEKKTYDGKRSYKSFGEKNRRNIGQKPKSTNQKGELKGFLREDTA